MFAEAGIADIRLPYPVHPSNAPRVLALLERAAISIIVDHRGVAGEWSRLMQRAWRRLDVLVKVDVGFHRCGIDPAGAGALDFVRAVASMPGLRLRGLLSHAGHGYLAASEEELRGVAAAEIRMLCDLRDSATRSGIGIDELSVGATPTLRFTSAAARDHGLPELRPGNYVYFDRTQVALGSASLEDCALTVAATVVSRPSPDRLILDCGSKTLTSDAARGFSPTPGCGVVRTADGAALDAALSIERLSEEHATVRVAGATTLEPGDRVRVLPNHSCVVVNMVDRGALAEGDRVIDMLPVAARGRIT